MRKQLYQQPITETLVVRFEGVICGSNPANTYHQGGAGYYSDFDTNDNGGEDY